MLSFPHAPNLGFLPLMGMSEATVHAIWMTGSIMSSLGLIGFVFLVVAGAENLYARYPRLMNSWLHPLIVLIVTCALLGPGLLMVFGVLLSRLCAFLYRFFSG